MPAKDSRLPDSGLLLVDKAQGVTSHDVVAAGRKLLHTKRVGHAGTLDPMATGLLILAFGNATRLLPMVTAEHKTYLATIRFGQATDTDDADGTIIDTPADAAVPLPDKSRLESLIDSRFLGTIEQVPSTYSAIKIDGKRAYELARAGEDVALRAREVTISRFDVLSTSDTQAADGTPVRDAIVIVDCSAGTYIRALARDLGAACGTGAHLVALRRVCVGDCRVDDPRALAMHTQTRTFTRRDGETMTRDYAVFDDVDDLPAHVLGMAQVARMAMPELPVNAEEARDLRFGRRLPLPLKERSAAILAGADELVAIVEPCGTRQVQPVTVFPADTATA